MQIVTRQQWGARHPAGATDRTGRLIPAPLPVSEVWLHHSVTIAPDLVEPFDDEDAAMRLLEQIGQQRFGQGISYTLAVMPSGRVYEGHHIGAVGAHTAGRNRAARAIVLVGNYDTTEPTAAQVESTAQLLVDGVDEGWWTAARLAGGHQQAPGASTACPGTHGMAVVPVINARAASLAQGAATPTPTREGSPDMRALRTPDGTIWLATEMEVEPTGNRGLAGSVAKVHNPGGAYIECTREEVEELRRYAGARRTKLLVDLSKLTVDVDEAELARQLAPMIVGQIDKLSAQDLGALAGAVATEAGRRLTAPPVPVPLAATIVPNAPADPALDDQADEVSYQAEVDTWSPPEPSDSPAFRPLI